MDNSPKLYQNKCSVFLLGLFSGMIFCQFKCFNMIILFSSPVFEQQEDPSSKSFFSEIISSISDVRFCRSGRYMLTRDYLTVKVWDMTMEKTPVEVFHVHDYLKNKLCSLYENDCIFDKFECSWRGDDRWVKGVNFP